MMDQGGPAELCRPDQEERAGLLARLEAAVAALLLLHRHSGQDSRRARLAR